MDDSGESQLTVFPKRSLAAPAFVLGAFALGAVCLGLGLWGLSWVTDRDPWGIVLLALAAGFAYRVGRVGREAVQQARHLVSPRPLLRLDEDGLECARGRLHWRDVESIYVRVGGEIEIARLGFALRPDAQILTPLAPPGYFDFWRRRTRLTDSGLEVDLWTSQDKALAKIRQFYDGPEGPPTTPFDLQPVSFAAVRNRRILVPVRRSGRGSEPVHIHVRRKRPWEPVRCFACGRKPRDREIPSIAWTAWSDRFDYLLLCPDCEPEFGPLLGEGARR